jgi:hypothetical protein
MSRNTCCILYIRVLCRDCVCQLMTYEKRDIRLSRRPGLSAWCPLEEETVRLTQPLTRHSMAAGGLGKILLARLENPDTAVAVDEGEDITHHACALQSHAPLLANNPASSPTKSEAPITPKSKNVFGSRPGIGSPMPTIYRLKPTPSSEMRILPFIKPSNVNRNKSKKGMVQIRRCVLSI